MDGQQEMRELQEIFDVIREITGFTGDVLAQLPGGAVYVEQKGVQAILEYLDGGGRVDTAMVRTELSDGLEQQMRECHVPYAAFAVTTEDEERPMMYAFRDKDRAIIKDIIREMNINLEGISMGVPPMRDRARELDVEPGL